MTVHVKKDHKVTYLSGYEVPQVGNLFIDKLSLTLKIPEALKEKVIAGFQSAAKDGWGITTWGKSYKHSMYLALASPLDESHILIQCSPNKPHYNFFRIEFNPSKADLCELKTIIDKIIPGGYSNLNANGIVTRIDFTVDVKNLSPSEVIASYPKIKIEKHISNAGITESLYLGSSASDKQLVLYDKHAEIMEKNKGKPSWLQKKIPPNKLLRIEVRYFKTGITLKDVETIPNVFQKVTLVAYPGSKSPKAYDPKWTLFLRVCQHEGVAAALSHLSNQEKLIYMKRITTEGKTDWWKPDAIWQGLPAAIKKITEVKGNSPPLLDLAV